MSSSTRLVIDNVHSKDINVIHCITEFQLLHSTYHLLQINCNNDADCADKYFAPSYKQKCYGNGTSWILGKSCTEESLCLTSNNYCAVPSVDCIPYN